MFGMKAHFTTMLLGILLLAVTVGGTGCVGLASSTLPPSLTATEKTRLKGAHLRFTVGVETNDAAPLVIARLRKTKLFDAVDYVDRLPSPPVVLAQWKNTPRSEEHTSEI